MSKKKRTAAHDPGPRRGRRLWLIPVVGIPACVAVVALWANPSLPDAPELEAVNLALPRTPAPSPQLDRLLREKPARLSARLEGAAGAALRDGQWLSDPLAVERELAEVRPLMERTRAALASPGCLPPEQRTDNAPEISYLGLSRGVRLLALQAVLEAQRGRSNEAARALLPLLDRLLALEKDCAPNLVAAMVLNMVLQQLGRAFGFVLAAPALDAGLEPQIWAGLLRLEQRPTPIPNALRWEAAFIREVLAQPPVRQPGDSAPSWPFYDRKDTIALGDRVARRNVWASEQPLSSPAWTEKYPETEFLERMARQPRPLLWVRYNSAGKTLIFVARPDHRRFALSWYRSRCLAAAQRARWVQDLRALGRAPRGAAAGAPALDPFSNQGFSGLEHRPVCGVPQRFLGGERLGRGDEPPPLPASPKAAASQPHAAP